MKSSLSEAFFKVAGARLGEYPQLRHAWEGPEKSGRRVLSIPKQDTGGFDVRIECESYGLYPVADGWHGAPWDNNPSVGTPEKIAEQCFGFLRTVLSPDAVLNVHFSAGKPYKWILSYPTGQLPVNDETGLLLFNYFGRREVREYRNRHLPSRADGTAT